MTHQQITNALKSYVDATIDIWSAKNIRLRTSREPESEMVFSSEQDLFEYLKKAYCSDGVV